jgi:quinol monooxygenase YgiN
MLQHDVYFTLIDSSTEARERLVQACHRYLRDHPGVVYFSAGVLEEGLNREVNDQAFHVALHVTFEDRAAHDAYQTVPDHLRFIEENKATWAAVRVFDSSVDGGAGRVG